MTGQILILAGGARHQVASTPQIEVLPIGGLLALAMTGFIAILTETMPAGLLPQIGAGLHVSPTLTGQVVSLYALGSLFAAIPLTAALQGWRRRPRFCLLWSDISSSTPLPQFLPTIR